MARPSSAHASREGLRARNQSAVINAIHRHGRISRTDLAAELHLSPAAITVITAPFVDEGLVVEAELGTSTSVGRKPILLEINYDHAFVVGVKVTNHSVIAALTNLKAELVECRTDRLPDHSVETVIDAIGKATKELQASSGIPENKLIGLGVNLPGIVEHHTGTVRHSPLLDWYHIPFADRLREKINLPVLVENDVNALAAAQAWFGHGRHHEAFLVLTLGRGVGLGIIVDGNVYRGPKGGAGEFGHTTLAPIQPRVMDSQAATLESLVSDSALLAQARRIGAALSAGAAPDELNLLAEDGNALALSLFQDAGELLGLALGNLVNIFAPSLIILGGEGVRSAAHFMPSLEATLEKHAFGDLAAGLELVVDTWGDDAWARGAAGLAAAHFLEEATIPLDAALTHRGRS